MPGAFITSAAWAAVRYFAPLLELVVAPRTWAGDHTVARQYVLPGGSLISVLPSNNVICFGLG